MITAINDMTVMQNEIDLVFFNDIHLNITFNGFIAFQMLKYRIKPVFERLILISDQKAGISWVVMCRFMSQWGAREEQRGR